MEGTGSLVDAEGGEYLFLGCILVASQIFHDCLDAVVVRGVVHGTVEVFQLFGKGLVIKFTGTDVALELKEWDNAVFVRVFEMRQEFREGFQSLGIVVAYVEGFRQVELDSEVFRVQFQRLFKVFQRFFNVADFNVAGAAEVVQSGVTVKDFFQFQEGEEAFQGSFLCKESFGLLEFSDVLFSGFFRQGVEFLNPGGCLCSGFRRLGGSVGYGKCEGCDEKDEGFH